MPVPDQEEFTKLIQQHVKRYRELDQIYLEAIENIKKAGLYSLSDDEVLSIWEFYLLDCGNMGRVLGHKGCRRAATTTTANISSGREKDRDKQSIKLSGETVIGEGA